MCNLLQLFRMRLLKHHQIKQQQLKLLETCGHSLAEYAQTRVEHQMVENNQNALFWKSIGKLQIKWLKNAGVDSNSNLKAFVHVLLHRIYSVSIQQGLLSLIKSVFYNPELDLTTVVDDSLCNLSNEQMKKLVVQFFYLLSYSFFDDKIEAKLNKYPILMNIFVLFLRKILSTLQVDEASDFNNHLPTNKIYSLLSLYFKLSLEAQDNCYIFPEVRMVVMHHQQSQYLIGTYTCEVAPSIGISDPSKMSIRTVEPSSNSQEDPGSPSKTSRKSFFPKKSIKISNQYLLKESAKALEGLKEFKGTIKKTKSLKEYPKRKNSNIESTYQIKAISTYDLTQASNNQCICQEKKQNKMALRSNLYEFSIKFVQKNRHNQGGCFITSKGFNCELYQTRRPQNEFMKRYFQEKKRLQTEHVHIGPRTYEGCNKKNKAISKVGGGANAEVWRRPVSEYSLNQLHFQDNRPSLLQNKPGVVLPKPLQSSPSFPLKPHQPPFLKNRNSATNTASQAGFL